MDDDGYPDDEELARIEGWTGKDLPGLFAYIHSLWHWPDYMKIDGPMVTASTGGWSGNESLIGALQRNKVAWIMSWQKIERGGHYEFKIPDYQVTAAAELAKEPS